MLWRTCVLLSGMIWIVGEVVTQFCQDKNAIHNRETSDSFPHKISCSSLVFLQIVVLQDFLPDSDTKHCAENVSGVKWGNFERKPHNEPQWNKQTKTQG